MLKIWFWFNSYIKFMSFFMIWPNYHKYKISSLYIYSMIFHICSKIPMALKVKISNLVHVVLWILWQNWFNSSCFGLNIKIYKNYWYQHIASIIFHAFSPETINEWWLLLLVPPLNCHSFFFEWQLLLLIGVLKPSLEALPARVQNC